MIKSDLSTTMRQLTITIPAAMTQVGPSVPWSCSFLPSLRFQLSFQECFNKTVDNLKQLVGNLPGRCAEIWTAVRGLQQNTEEREGSSCRTSVQLSI